MNILIMGWDAYGQLEIKTAFEELGHYCALFPFDCIKKENDTKYENILYTEIEKQNPDFVFSFNYWPIISKACNRANIKYASWTYDSPFVQLYSSTIINSCNYAFIFDKALYNEFHSNGIHTVHYLPLAADAKRLSTLNDFNSFNNSFQKNETDIAFIGQLYTEKSQIYSKLKNIKPYTKGYLEGIMAAQKNIYGINFIKEILTPDIIDDMIYDIHLEMNPDGVETIEYLIAQYVINRQITSMERTETLLKIGSKYPFDLYTTDAYIKLPNCINHGKINALKSAPYVYKSAKINLNITLRSITTGIPLRAFEIMGNEGFCLSNYQSDFSDCYVAERDYVYYENLDDMLDKIDYYLNHESERLEIAHNGFLCTLEYHSYLVRAQQIIDVIFNDIIPFN